MTTQKCVLGMIVLLSGAVGCGPPLEPDGTPGSMRAGGFVYCDPAGHCGFSDPLPDAIAVGSLFGLEFDGDADAVLVSSNDDRLLTLQRNQGITQFRAMVAGPATVEVRDSVDDQLMDTVTLSLARAASLRPGICARAFNAITKSDVLFDPLDCTGDDIGAAGITIARGASLAPTVCVLPLDATGNALAGLLAGKFSATGAAALEMHVDAGGRCATIGSLTLGDAAVTASAGDLQSTFAVRVMP